LFCSQNDGFESLSPTAVSLQDILEATSINQDWMMGLLCFLPHLAQTKIGTSIVLFVLTQVQWSPTCQSCCCSSVSLPTVPCSGVGVRGLLLGRDC
jgi:hypothetical protein